MRIRLAIKAGLAGALERSGLFDLYRLARTAARGPLIHVLGYHRVVDRFVENGPVHPALCITTAAFRRQMEQVRARFRVLTLDEAVRAIAGRLPLERDACAITFDDGYRDVRLRAHPILEELDLPATVFVPTGPAMSGAPLTHDRLYAALWDAHRRRHPLGGVLPRSNEGLARALSHAEAALQTDGPGAAVDLLIATRPAADLERLCEAFAPELERVLAPDDGARVMAPEELRELAGAGWEIGAHTIGHVVLTHESPARAAVELAQPRRDLEAWTDRPCRFLAWCNGLFTAELARAAVRAGYQGAVTTRDRPNLRGGDPMRVGRKVLWEAHTRGLGGRFSPSISAAHLHDLFGALRLTTPEVGELFDRLEVPSCAG